MNDNESRGLDGFYQKVLKQHKEAAELAKGVCRLQLSPLQESSG